MINFLFVEGNSFALNSDAAKSYGRPIISEYTQLKSQTSDIWIKQSLYLSIEFDVECLDSQYSRVYYSRCFFSKSCRCQRRRRKCQRCSRWISKSSASCKVFAFRIDSDVTEKLATFILIINRYDYVFKVSSSGRWVNSLNIDESIKQSITAGGNAVDRRRWIMLENLETLAGAICRTFGVNCCICDTNFFILCK